MLRKLRGFRAHPALSLLMLAFFGLTAWSFKSDYSEALFFGIAGGALMGLILTKEPYA